MCDYCTAWCHKLIVDTGTLSAFVTTGGELCVEFHGTYDQEYDVVPINYCPMCGRDLRGGERPMRTLDDESPVTVPYGLAHMMVSGTIRYYMGRHTIAAHAVADGIAKLLPQLAESTRCVLERDLRRWLDENPTCEFGCVDDREPWARLLEAIKEGA